MENDKKPKPLSVSQDTEITIPLRNLIGIAIGISLFVGQYFILNGRLEFLEDGVVRSEVDVAANTEFRILWPRGDLGQLPEDFEQSVRLDHAEEDIQNLYRKVETLGIMVIEDSKD